MVPNENTDLGEDDVTKATDKQISAAVPVVREPSPVIHDGVYLSLIHILVPELTELSFYYMNLVTVSRLQRNPTVKSEIHMRNFETVSYTHLDMFPLRGRKRGVIK